MSQLLRFLVMGLLGVLAPVISAWAIDCAAVLPNLLDDRPVKSFADLQETHSLMELVSADPANNLAVKHPLIVMNAPQRLSAFINSIPPVEIPDPLYGGTTVRLYPVFSGGMQIADGKMIIGQDRQINDFVDYVEAGARGDGAAVKLPLFTGPSGTGKSEFLTILQALANHLTTSNPDYYVYTFRWKNLSKIAELKPFLRGPVAQQNGQETELPREPDMKLSPFVLLPEAVQEKVLGLAHSRAVKLGKVDPNPSRALDPQTRDIRDAILKHHARALGKKELSNREIVEILDQHVEIVRMDGAKNFVKLEAQGKDVPYHEIFFAENPYIMTEYGPGHPFSYFLNGTVLQSNGGMLLLDELPRNPSELRDTFLGVIEDRTIQRGGSPEIELDAVIVGAGNDQSIDKIKADGTAAAHLDRSRLIPMRLSIQPWEVSKTMLLMKKEQTLLMKKLDPTVGDEAAADKEPSAEDTSGWIPGKLNDLFPIPMRGEFYVGPDRRFSIAIKTESKEPPVILGPHTLDFMAYTIAATRLVTDKVAAEKLGKYGVIKSHVFTDYITRLKVLTGKLNIQSDERMELAELSLLLKEGTQGVSNRDAAHAWLTKAIAEARKPENENTLTPAIMLETFDQLLQEGGITYPDAATRLDWLNKIVAIGRAFVVPWIESDVMEAMSSGRESINEIYDEVKHELLALSEDRAATRYSMPGRKPRDINTTRLNHIRAYYQTSRGRDLDAGEVMNFHVRYARESDRRHEGLLGAINQMLAQKNAELVSWDALANYGRTKRGDAEVASKYSRLVSYLTRALGYNERSLQMALEFKQQLEKVRGKNLGEQ